MKKILLTLFVSFLCYKIFSQTPPTFKVRHLIKTSPLKDQQSSGTCWSFATTSFIETEAIRLGKTPVVLSPIFYVPPTYINKAKKFVETKGNSWLDAGDLTFSVLDSYRKFGAIPETVYNGIIEGDWQHDHVEMDNAIEAIMQSVATSGYGRIKPSSWKKSLQGILNAYLGEVPETFIYEQKEYTPREFANEFIGINPDDYLEETFEKRYLNFPFYIFKFNFSGICFYFRFLCFLDCLFY